MLNKYIYCHEFVLNRSNCTARTSVSLELELYVNNDLSGQESNSGKSFD